MGRLVIITNALEGLGFGLAGVEVFSADEPRMAAVHAQQVMERKDVSLVAIREEYYEAFNPELKNILNRCNEPLFFPLPRPVHDDSQESMNARWSRLMQWAGLEGKFSKRNVLD